FVEDFANGDECGFGVERVEYGFNEEQGGAAGDEGAGLLFVCRLDLVEGDDAEAGVVGVGRVGEGDGEGADGSRYEALPGWFSRNRGICGAVGFDAALAGGGLIDLPGEAAEGWVFDDLLVEVGVLAATVL